MWQVRPGLGVCLLLLFGGRVVGKEAKATVNVYSAVFFVVSVQYPLLVDVGEAQTATDRRFMGMNTAGW